MIRPFESLAPRIAPSAFIAPSAEVIGDVHVGDGSSIWYQTVVRGDLHRIRIGARTNIQDRCVLHITTGRHPVEVGDDVTVGHGAVIHGCRVGSQVLVGIGAMLLDGVDVGERSVVAAGALLAPGKAYPPRSLILGSPARVVRETTDDEVRWIERSAVHYVELAGRHAALTDRPPS